MDTNLRNFLEIPYDELEDLNLEAKEKVTKRTADESLREHYLKYLAEEKRIKAVVGSNGLSRVWTGRNALPL